MSNPLMNMIGGMMGNNNPMQMVQQVMGMVRGSNNPQSMVESMAQTTLRSSRQWKCARERTHKKCLIAYANSRA